MDIFQKWFNELKGRQRMLVRVVLTFLAALLFWGFYSNVVIEGAELKDYFPYLILSVLLVAVFIYLELGRNKKP
ncbi:MAG: hypothetical protein PVH45_05035 [Candidatus Omnitrophota bacterium]|jgi:hypothetical protein